MGEDEGLPRQDFEYLTLAGYFLAGALMSLANLLYAVGCFGVATRRAVTVVASSAVAHPRAR